MQIHGGDPKLEGRSLFSPLPSWAGRWVLAGEDGTQQCVSGARTKLSSNLGEKRMETQGWSPCLSGLRQLKGFDLV